MNQLTKIGRLFYGIGIVAIGIHQLIIKDFRPDILPPFPAWAHHYTIFPVITGLALMFAGIIMTGLIPIKLVNTKKVCLYVGCSFLVLILFCHLPYILILSPDKISQLEVWFGAGEALAYGGGAFVMTGSFSEIRINGDRKNSFELFLEKLIPFGRIFYSLLIVLFGVSHFVFTAAVSKMVPQFLGMHFFWTYLIGIAIVGSGLAIMFKLWIKFFAFLLAIMLFLFFIFFHLPDAIANPYVSGGNEIVRALVAVMFCGIALVISSTNRSKNGLS